ncbi:NAD(P)-binding protein [Wolfiporia cocos MD-104 SS10]|uniref:NAD(P)-binding protein n=1 Tax=Wolfiporia cocos (strain MD-104) TaxID=742152 RepID=A0A2H3JZI1_WOLCO|nr:NAD(P)-binding protein [Wolfiporia cocos MD-104 SS10]
MSQKPVIVVVTATGAQGRSVCEAFRASGCWRVRALTRDASGPVARRYADEGIEVVQANFENKEDLIRAFRGALLAFGCTIPPWHQAYSNTLSEYDQGVLQVDAAKVAGVALFFWSTLPYVGPEFGGLGGVELYDSKAKINDYIVSVGLPAVFIGTPAFIDNVMSWPLIRRSNDGMSLETWNHVVGEENPVAFLWVEHDLGPAVLALASHFCDSGIPFSQNPLNHTLQPLASWRGSWGAVSRCIGQLTGISTSHTVMPNVNERWNPDLTKAFIYQNTHGLYPHEEFPPRLLIDLRVKFGTLEEYVQQKVVPFFPENVNV